MFDLVQTAKEIRKNLFGLMDTAETQVFCLAEEAGEFVGAFRRWADRARRRGTKEEMELELADVVIAAYVAAEYLDIDLDEAIAEKTAVIFSRGWKESR